MIRVILPTHLRVLAGVDREVTVDIAPGQAVTQRTILDAVEALESCGIYFGTTGGQVYASADAGDHWSAIARDLPPVLSVEVQTLP